MTEDDVLFGFRLRCLTLADELGNVSAACRAMGIERSTYYRWKRKVDRWGLEALRIRERRRPRMPNQIGPHLEQRILAFALARPGFGPRRISSELARPKWGGIAISEHGIWRVLRRFNLNTRSKRLALVARHAEPYERKPEIPPPERHIEASEPGEKVQLDCFFVGRLSGSKGTVWQYTASDVASGFIWAELHSSARNPRARWTAELVHRVARELKAAGWKLREVTTDRQWLGVRLARVRDGLRSRRRASVAHQGRAPELQRLRRARPADDPRGVLASGLRALAGAQDHRASPRPRRVPRGVQLRPRPQRAPDQGKGSRGYRLRRPQDGNREMSPSCCNYSGLGRTRCALPCRAGRPSFRVAAASSRQPGADSRARPAQTLRARPHGPRGYAVGPLRADDLVEALPRSRARAHGASGGSSRAGRRRSPPRG